jgi:hypothetical protein
MQDLINYVYAKTDRGECKCGRCVDMGNKPDPTHAADIFFFKVAAQGDPNLEEFSRLTKEFKGVFGDCNPFDGKEHGYIELGAWIGDQQLALRYMGLGVLLGAFELMTPVTMLNLERTDPLAAQMAGIGMVVIQAKQ